MAIDERSTTVLWSNDSLARRELSAPSVFSSYVAVGDKEGYLHLLSQVDGRFVARTRIDSAGLRTRPVVEGDWLYAYGNDGKLVALTIRQADCTHQPDRRFVQLTKRLISGRCLAAAFVFSEISQWRAAWFP